MMNKAKKQIDTEGVKRLRESGYNPIHLFGTLHLVRNKSKNYTKIPIYILKRYPSKNK